MRSTHPMGKHIRDGARRRDLPGRRRRSAAQQITDDDLPERDPTFSPDGSKIAYVHFARFDNFGEDGSSREPSGPAIVTSDPTGQTSRQIPKPGIHPAGSRTDGGDPPTSRD